MRRWRAPVIGAAIAVVLVVAFFLGFYQPRSDRIVGLAAETRQLQAQQAVLHHAIGVLELVKARRTELDAGLHMLDELIPSELAQPAALAQLQAVAGAAGVKLVSVTFGDPELPKDGPKSDVPGTVLVDMPVTIAVEGPFLRITDLLRRVEVEMHRAVLIDNVALTEGDAGFPVLTGTCSGRAFALLTEGDPLLAAARKKSGTAGVPTPSPAPAPASSSP